LAAALMSSQSNLRIVDSSPPAMDAIFEDGLAEAGTQNFRHAMRGLASGVSLVTFGAGEERNGLTATSVSSLSIEPPTLLVAVNRAASGYSILKASQVFGISVLGAHQQEFAERFSGRIKGASRYNQGRWLTLPSGVSLLADSVAAFECEIEDIIERHSHAIVIGRVRRLVAAGGASALVYWRGAYEQLGWTEEEIACAIGLSANRKDG
jgi:flavin reductase (DIM6/NTAB) family NADH-FMN oxidoreductase RutF